MNEGKVGRPFTQHQQPDMGPGGAEGEPPPALPAAQRASPGSSPASWEPG